ncbi:MAG: aminotransferase class V-fold PLP-dependent enzyme [Thaumarchaeota archaeon]|nr:aminotransferase class V-fold PLP-dependent enzyme [Nitrososphaerota archaeon]
MNLSKYRQDFPITKRFVFLDHANMSPSPVQVVRAVSKLMREKAGFAYMKFEVWGAQVEQARQNVAKMLGARKEGVWFANNTSDGINIVANGVAWRKGDNVVMPDIEFPSVVYPFLKRRGMVDLRYAKTDYSREGVQVPISEFERLVDDRTKVVCLSAVDYGFGCRYDLRAVSEIAHRHGAIALVDASQAAGAVQMHIDADGVDAVAFGGQKWTFAPSAGGVFYMNPSTFDIFTPPFVGWYSVADPMNQILTNYTEHFEIAADARRFATGHPNFPGIVGLAASSQYLRDVGFSRVEARCLEVSGYLMRRLAEEGFTILTPRENGRRASIVSFVIPDGKAVIEGLKKKRIIVSGYLQTRQRGIRVSPAFYNTNLEVDRLVENLPKVSRQKSNRRKASLLSRTSSPAASARRSSSP